ncbi:hypothetical protein HRbin38_00337 [bacterium HR38]|nr:hypothetical protein HRbin38_00337 [bacterium HR38]
MGHVHRLAVLAVPGRDLVPPPELAGDVPVPNIPEPVQVYLLPALGHEGDLIPFQAPDHLVRQGLHGKPPLGEDGVLQGGAAAGAGGHLDGVVLLLQEVACLPEELHRLLPGFEPVQAPQGLRHPFPFHAPFQVDDGNRLQPVPFPDLVVQGVVGWGHLEGPGAELPLHGTVRQDGDPDVREGYAGLFADKVPVALVLGVDGDGLVSEDGFRPYGGDGDAFATFRLVGQGVELARGGLRFHLQV